MAPAILIVDDDATARKAIERALSSESRLQTLAPRVVHAADGQTALALLETERPQVVITDLYMPGMDGFAFCRALRKAPGGERISLLVVSGVFTDPAIIAKLAKEFRAGFLSKPLQASLLADAVMGMLRHATPPPQAQPAVPQDVSSEMRALASPIEEAPERGTLAERAVPELLFDLMESGATGKVLLVRGQTHKAIYLRAGRVVAADSNARSEALGALLCANGVLDEQRLQYLLSETKHRKKKMGAVLVELGWMTPGEVLGYLASQARLRLVDCLRWTEGAWGIIRGDSFQGKIMEHDLDGPLLVFRGLARTATAEGLGTRFGEGAEVLRLLPRFEKFGAAFDGAFGPKTRPALTEAANIAELTLRPNGQLLLAAVEALVLTGSGTLEAPTAASFESSPATPAADLLALDRLGAEIDQQFRLIQVEAPDEFAPAKTGAAERVLRDEGPTPADPLDTADSGTVEIFTRPRTNPGVGTTTLPTENAEAQFRTAILREYLDIHDKSFYGVLGISPDASAEQIARAYHEKRRRFSPEALRGIDLAQDRPKVQTLLEAYDRAFRTLSDPSQRRTQDVPTSEPSRHDALGAELAFTEGMGLLHAGKSAEAVKRFHRAVEARPDQAAYHAFLAWGLFRAQGRSALTSARKRLEHALTLDPGLARAHELLGRLAISEGDHRAAQKHLERSLEIDPAQLEAVELLLTTHARLEDPGGAERACRRLLAALGDRGLPVRRRLWRDLADLYEKKLHNADSARIAYEKAAHLAPADLKVQRKVLELNAQDPSRWREAARALLAEWQQNPSQPRPGAELVDLFLKAQQFGAASLAAAARVLRGQADEKSHGLAERGQPLVLPKMTPSAAREDLVRPAAHPDEDPNIEALLSTLAEVGALEPFSDADLGLELARPLAPGQRPSAFEDVLRILRKVLRSPEALVVRPLPELGLDARLADVRPYALLVGPDLLQSKDSVELGFRLGRALALGTPGRIAGSARSGRQLRPYLLASLAVTRGTGGATEPEVDVLYRRLVTQSHETRLRIADIGKRIIQSRSTVNLGRWTRALSRTATRVGLLVSGDLLRVGRAVADEDGPEALDDLLAFALSPEHLALREQLHQGGTK